MTVDRSHRKELKLTAEDCASMEETHLDISVRIGLAIFEAPVPVALMGFVSCRILFNDGAFLDRCVTLPHRCQVALVERAGAYRLIPLTLTIRMLEHTFRASATLKHPLCSGRACSSCW